MSNNKMTAVKERLPVQIRFKRIDAPLLKFLCGRINIMFQLYNLRIK